MRRAWRGLFDRRRTMQDTKGFVRESLLQEEVNGRVRCNVCERRCVIVPGGLGCCRTRENVGGRLVTLVYGAVSSLAANPIEKKPLYHFYPGTHALTAGSWSCNFGCPWCQNWGISKAAPASSLRPGPVRSGTGGGFLPPGRFVELAESAGCQGTSISFNEPTLSLEWSLEVFRLARRRGLYNTYVTNGYMTPEALSLLIDAGLDAMNVDIRSRRRHPLACQRVMLGVPVHRTADAGLDAGAGLADRQGGGAGVRLHGQCARTSWRQHLLSCVRRHGNPPVGI